MFLAGILLPWLRGIMGGWCNFPWGWNTVMGAKIVGLYWFGGDREFGFKSSNEPSDNNQLNQII